MKQWTFYCSTLLRHSRAAFLTFTAEKKYQVRTLSISHRQGQLRNKINPRRCVKEHGVRISPKRAARGAEFLWRIAPRLSFVLLPGEPHFIFIRNKFQVCFWPGCCLLTLAFCESACCHGDHHLDNSSEQGVVKWMKRTHSTMHSGAGRVPVRLRYHCWVAVTLGCHKASQSLLGSPLYSHLLRICLFIAPYMPLTCDFSRDASDCSDVRNLSCSGLPRLSITLPIGPIFFGVKWFQAMGISQIENTGTDLKLCFFQCPIRHSCLC